MQKQGNDTAEGRSIPLSVSASHVICQYRLEDSSYLVRKRTGFDDQDDQGDQDGPGQQPRGGQWRSFPTRMVVGASAGQTSGSPGHSNAYAVAAGEVLSGGLISELWKSGGCRATGVGLCHR